MTAISARRWDDDAQQVELSLREPERFGVVFDRHFAEIHGYVARRLGRDAADDVAAETFLTAFGSRRRFDPSRGTVRAWLYGIVTNHMSGYHRQEVRAYRTLALAGLQGVEEGHADRVAARVDAGAAGRELARAILLTAARTAARAAQPAPERYYVTPGIVGNFVRVGPPGNRYLVLEVVNRQDWAATDPRDGSPDLSQARYVQAASPADEAAWRRDGSPGVWKGVGQETGLADPLTPSDGWLLPLSLASGKLTAGSAGYGAQPFIVGDKSLSLRQLRALPANPAKLKTLLLAGWADYSGVGSATSYLFQTVPAVLEMPVTPAVRSALYKLLASLAGVQSIGAITDVAGQQGTAVAYTARYSGCGQQFDLTSPGPPFPALFSSCTIEQVLIIGPGDGMPLAEELRYTQLPAGQHWSAPDGLFSYEVFGSPYWTNHDRPSPPKN
jgi:DNA-directed RNA polymerase specialized sigma24 family protein